jgi:hypothetical protein
MTSKRVDIAMKNRRDLVLMTTLAIAASASAQAAFADSMNEPTASTTVGVTPDEQAFLQTTDAKWSKMIGDGSTMLTSGKETPAISMFKRALTQVQRIQADQNAKDRMCAIANKKLGQCYCQKGDYVKADTNLKEAKTVYDRLAIRDEELTRAFDELAKHYKTIDVTSLGESVTKQMKEAGVNKIAVFRQEEKDLVEINLDQKYIKPIDSKDVPKISFNKKVSFEFFNRPNGDYQVSKITGLQVLAKSLWVNLMESLVKVGDKPVAEVTAGKMGMTKTVTVDIPKDMFDSTKEILDNLIASIKGQPAYAATPAASGASGSSGAAVTSTPVGSSYGGADINDSSYSGGADTNSNSSNVPPPSPDPQDIGNQ